MTAKRTSLFFATLAICATVWAADKADFGKRKLESPTENVVANSAELPDLPDPPVRFEAPPKARLDIGKGRIELATERLLDEGELVGRPAHNSEARPARNRVEQAPALPQTVADTQPPAPTFENPKVAPGKVRWHANLETARAASGKSGKPVLLFQMMGNLDARFC